MVRCVALVLFSSCLAVSAAAQTSPTAPAPSAGGVTYVERDKTATVFASGGRLGSGPDFAASVALRARPG